MGITVITIEQATAAVLKERSGDDEYELREARIREATWVNWKEIERPDEQHYRHWMVECCEWEPMCWSVFFDFRTRSKASLGQPEGAWTDWYVGHCYVVEPVMGAYVVK